MTLARPRPELDELLYSMGEAGARICDIDASEAGAGNISLYIGWDIEVRRKFPVTSEITLPVSAPALAGGTLLVTGSGRRLRQIAANPLACIGAVRVHADGTTGTLHSAPSRLFEHLTSEFNSHLAVHQDQIERRGIDFHAVVHAQPPHLTYLSHIPAYRNTEAFNRALMRWEPETIVAVSQGIGVLDFLIPGSNAMHAANVAGLRDHEIVLWSKHGTMSRSDASVTRAADLVDYMETAARYEYMDIMAGRLAEGLTPAEVASVASEFGVATEWATERKA